MRLAIPVLVTLLLAACPARASIILIIPDEFDDVALIRDARDKPEVKALSSRIDEFKKRLCRLKERDILAAFGEPRKKPAKTYALPVAQPRSLDFSGIWSDDPAQNKDHIEFHAIKNIGALKIYYDADGVSPMDIVVYFAADKDFPRLDANNLKQRLAWETARLKALIAHAEARLAEVFPWEVDREELAKINTGDYQANAADNLQAWIASGPDLKLTYQHQEGSGLWRWHDETGHLVREITEGKKTSGPDLFTIYHPNREISRIDIFSFRKGKLMSRRWLRKDGSGIFRLEDDDSWCWWGKNGDIIRLEWDDNGDGIPDWYLTEDDKPKDMCDREAKKKKKPLAIEGSWAIDPKLIPEECQLIDQPDLRVPVRKKAAATPGK
ncbi:hypothetical protein [Zavarzinella formosa]|uniref:hypothetical protein n=1 Tax=Zavarzinella formosa TaxID=360055 RepID=UPI0002F7449D|nr:hypothetical protein [Zavarzinella formosa]